MEMEAINDSSKLVAMAIELLGKAQDEFKWIDYTNEAIKLLHRALKELTDEM